MKRTDTAYASVREQNEPITDAFGVGELMNSKGERSAMRRDSAHKIHNFSRLPDVEAVKRLIHQQHLMWRQQCQRQHQAARVALRQCANVLTENFFKANRSCHLVKFGSPAKSGCKKFQNADDMLVIPWPHTIRKIKDDLAPAVLGQRRVLPENATCIGRQQSRDGLQEGGLARTIGADEAQDFTAPDIKRNISERALLAVPLSYAGDL
jgi:hypothetical protein